MPDPTEPKDVPIHTVGYGGRPINDFIAVLKSFDIVMLVDVRSQPYSRYAPDYRRESLERALGDAGIAYRWMGAALGGRPVQAACYVDGRVDYERVREQRFFQDALADLHALSLETSPLSIMCAEKKPESCHRMRLVGIALDAAGAEVIHIDGVAEARPHAEVVEAAQGPQLDLFAQQP